MGIGKYNKSEYRKHAPYDKGGNKKSYLKKPQQTEKSEGNHPLRSTSPKNPPTKPKQSKRPSQSKKQQSLSPTQSRAQKMLDEIKAGQKPVAQQRRPSTTRNRKNKQSGGTIVGSIFGNLIFAVVLLSIFQDAPGIVHLGIIAFFGFKIYGAFKE